MIMEKEKLKPLHEFIKSWMEHDRGLRIDVDWAQRYIDAGYYRMILSDHSNWSEIHDWCEQEFGGNHYSWNGSNFWFETQEDAFRFALRWGSA